MAATPKDSNPTNLSSQPTAPDPNSELPRTPEDLKTLASGVLTSLSELLGESKQTGLPVTLQPPSEAEDYAKCLWGVIKERTNAIGFNAYDNCLEGIFCTKQTDKCPSITLENASSYKLLEAATEAFLKQESGFLCKETMEITKQSTTNCLNPEALCKKLDKNELNKLREQFILDLGSSDSKIPLPYMQLIRKRLAELPLKSDAAIAASTSPDSDRCYGISLEKTASPTMIELIWSYWMEESLLVQTMNAITRRFQNVRNGLRDPLARLDIDPLRPLNSLIWGYIQDEPARLSLVRRAYEYDHHYGFSLVGKAVPRMSAADSRSRFLQAFHQLLNLAHQFFRAYDDMTVKADAFPLLNGLREVHLVLSEGAHNQYGDLPWVARKEMLMMQWLLARPEMREFIGGRIMTPQKERWMDRVDGMKRLQSWSPLATTHFVDLAQAGERLLLSIRFASWTQIESVDVARSWAVFWRDDIQRYTHAYRAVTGVDLSVSHREPDSHPPSYWLQRREPSYA